MILSAASSLQAVSASEKTPGVPAVTQTERPKAVNSDKPIPNQSQFVPSVSVSLSTDAKSISRESAPDSLSPVYSRPDASFSVQKANSSESISAARPDSSNENSRAGNTVPDEDKQETDSASFTNSISNLSEQELQIVDKLQARDREVRAHEQAHKSVGGQYAGAISFTYQSGPDGRRYAVGGEVPIDVSPVPGDPRATIAKMTIVKAAATAPAQPSTQDIMVAAEASRVLMDAQNELTLQSNDKIYSEADDEDKAESAASVNNYTGTQNAIGERSSQTQTDVFQLISGLGTEMESRVDILI